MFGYLRRCSNELLTSERELVTFSVTSQRQKIKKTLGEWKRISIMFRVHSDSVVLFIIIHDDVINRKRFPRYLPLVRGIHWSPVNSPHKGQWRGALMFSLICTQINGWVNNREAGDLRGHGAHYNVTVMWTCCCWGQLQANFEIVKSPPCLSRYSRYGDRKWAGLLEVRLKQFTWPNRAEDTKLIPR